MLSQQSLYYTVLYSSIVPSIVPGAEKGVPLSPISLAGAEQLNGKFSKMEGIADTLLSIKD